MHRIRFATLIAALAIAATACSGSGSTAAPGSAAAPGSTAAAGSTDSGSTAPAVTVPSFASAGGGSCGVQIDGDVTKAWHSDQTMGTLQMDSWLGPDQRSALNLGAADEGFLMNCQDASGSVSLTTTEGTTATTFPQGAGTYVIRQQLSGAPPSAPGQITALVNLNDKNIWGVSEPGTLTITTLGTNHFVGTFEFKIATTGSNSISASISGSFDLGCTSGTCV